MRQDVSLVWLTGGTVMSSSISIVGESGCWVFSLRVGGGAGVSVSVRDREKLCGNCPSLARDFSSSAARNRSLTSSTRFVLSPPFQITTAAAMPHRKLAGIRIPVLHAGRWNLPWVMNPVYTIMDCVLTDSTPTWCRIKQSRNLELSVFQPAPQPT